MLHNGQNCKRWHKPTKGPGLMGQALPPREPQGSAVLNASAGSAMCKTWEASVWK